MFGEFVQSANSPNIFCAYTSAPPGGAEPPPLRNQAHILALILILQQTLRWVIRMCSRTCRWHVHEPVRTLVNSSIFSHEAGRVRRTPLPCEKMQANLSISAASEERSSIPFPRFAKAPRKLHIRCVLLPSPNRTRFARLRFGYGIFCVKIRHNSTVILIELPCFSFCAMMNMRQRRQHSSFAFPRHFKIPAISRSR